MIRTVIGRAFLLMFLATAVALPASSQNSAIVHGTEYDINRFMDAEKPNPEALAALKARATQQPPPGLSSAALADFLFARAISKRRAGLATEALADAELAIRTGVGTSFSSVPAKIFMGNVVLEVGYQPRRALEIFKAAEKDADRPGVKGFMFTALRGIAQSSMILGDRWGAEQALARSRAFFRESKAWPPFTELGVGWEAQLEATAYVVAIGAENFDAAESAARRAEVLARRAAAGMPQSRQEWQASLTALAEQMVLAQARAKVGMGRLAEAEADVRGIIISRIQASGRHQYSVVGLLSQLRMIKFQQGLYADALEINRRVFETLRELGVASTSRGYVEALNNQALILLRMGRRDDLAATYAEIDKATAQWDEQSRAGVRDVPHRLVWLTSSGREMEAREPASRLVERMTAMFGVDNRQTAYARAILANILVRSGKLTEGIAEFRQALPVLVDATGLERDDIDAGGTAGFDIPTRSAVLDFLYAVSLETRLDPALVNEAFRYAEMIRPDSVQQALTASSLRAASQDPRLAQLIRSEQDAAKTFARAVATLQAALEVSPDQRDEKALGLLRADVERARKERATLMEGLRTRFPRYQELVAPAVPSIADVQKVMRPREIFVSIMVGQSRSFVWVIPKVGQPRYFRTDLGRIRVGELVERVRRSLDASASTILDLQPFDLLAASTLYDAFLKPAEDLIDASDSLIVATFGRLSGLPFGLLPRSAPELDLNAEPLFAAYRDVPWLIRTHAITVIPSAASLKTLRQAASSAPGRAPFLGFGDPVFGSEQRDDARQPLNDLTTRGVRGIQLSFRNAPTRSGVNASTLSDLQRLPDTADELRAIAAALGGNAEDNVWLRDQANERKVKQLRLADYQVVAFATHGLRAGEIHGLKGPALALSAPVGNTIDDDGLLTMDEILQLKLDADWVILSACNTASSAQGEQGMEVASGLGRAFFYAGTKALLVTGWSVHSASARDLISDLFRRQVADKSLNRGRALQQAMQHLMDEGGIRDVSGTLAASYAHPVFWAPYMLVGDGGVQQ